MKSKMLALFIGIFFSVLCFANGEKIDCPSISSIKRVEYNEVIKSPLAFDSRYFITHSNVVNFGSEHIWKIGLGDIPAETATEALASVHQHINNLIQENVLAEYDDDDGQYWCYYFNPSDFNIYGIATTLPINTLRANISRHSLMSHGAKH